MSNHEMWRTCPDCGFTYDYREYSFKQCQACTAWQQQTASMNYNKRRRRRGLFRRIFNLIILICMMRITWEAGSIIVDQLTNTITFRSLVTVLLTLSGVIMLTLLVMLQFGHIAVGRENN